MGDVEEGKTMSIDVQLPIRQAQNAMAHVMDEWKFKGETFPVQFVIDLYMKFADGAQRPLSDFVDNSSAKWSSGDIRESLRKVQRESSSYSFEYLWPMVQEAIAAKNAGKATVQIRWRYLGGLSFGGLKEAFRKSVEKYIDGWGYIFSIYKDRSWFRDMFGGLLDVFQKVTSFLVEVGKVVVGAVSAVANVIDRTIDITKYMFVAAKWGAVGYIAYLVVKPKNKQLPA